MNVIALDTRCTHCQCFGSKGEEGDFAWT